MTGKNKLVNAHILLQCTDPKHDGLCEELRNALVDNFYEVEEASAVTQITGDTDFCVTGIARINPDKTDKFKTALKDLHVHSKRNSKVKNVRIYLESK